MQTEDIKLLTQSTDLITLRTEPKKVTESFRYVDQNEVNSRIGGWLAFIMLIIVATIPFFAVQFAFRIAFLIKESNQNAYKQDLVNSIAKYQNKLSDWHSVETKEEIASLEKRFDDVTKRYASNSKAPQVSPMKYGGDNSTLYNTGTKFIQADEDYLKEGGMEMMPVTTESKLQEVHFDLNRLNSLKDTMNLNVFSSLNRAIANLSFTNLNKVSETVSFNTLALEFTNDKLSTFEKAQSEQLAY